jgi:hypothetical protein
LKLVHQRPTLSSKGKVKGKFNEYFRCIKSVGLAR